MHGRFLLLRLISVDMIDYRHICSTLSLDMVITRSICTLVRFTVIFYPVWLDALFRVGLMQFFQIYALFRVFYDTYD
jgi:hypothetical protein